MKEKKYYIYGGLLALLVGSLIISFRKKTKFEGKSIIIGDSHAVGISKLLKNTEKINCAVGGWRVSDLINCLNNSPVRTDVGKVIISIGTNGIYSSSDKVETLIDILKSKYPNATLYAFGGSYGWSGTLTRTQVEERTDSYYNRFKKKSVILLKNGLGYFKTSSEAHSITSPQAKAIAEEINSLTLK